jgi:dTDP-4-dehydrorhamnose 3,5-epimerase
VFRFKEVEIDGLRVIEYDQYADERGCFAESYRASEFEANSIPNLVQENYSRSSKGVLRGLHYQLKPHAQGKLVRCVYGQVFDVAVDLRRHSPTFGKHYSITLSDTEPKMLWVPEGFAHGFCALTDQAVLLYKTSDYYSPANERSLLWNDVRLGIEWPVEYPILSTKDQAADTLNNCDTNF